MGGGGNASALILLESARFHVTSISNSSPTYGSYLYSFSLIFLDIGYGREKVVRALVSRGAFLDTLHNLNEHSSMTTVGFGIKKTADAAMLSLCQSLGGDLSCVSLLASTCQEVDSAMEYSIFVANQACLAFILDVLHYVRPVVLSRRSILYLVAAAHTGDEGINLSYSLKYLETQGEHIQGILIADIFFEAAQRSGSTNKRLVRYLAKDLGLVSNFDRIQECARPADDAREAT